MGGEKCCFMVSSSSGEGSPPRGRGKEQPRPSSFWSVRITPAWAGKRAVFQFLVSHIWDHPRVGGEKLFCSPGGKKHSGSPPRGRGKAKQKAGRPPDRRITPAWAGKSASGHATPQRAGDHPRVGGEKQPDIRQTLYRGGSPPRGRGKAPLDNHRSLSEGITPAWAGKRLKRSHRSGIFISGPIPFHSVLHRPAGSGGSRAGRDGSPAGQPQNTGPA